MLSDRSRLIKRTQKDRKQDDESYSIETFDDSDFYQEILKQVINSNLNVNIDEVDSTEITRRWLKIQERRARKRSRPVTTYHTRKAKKLSYEVHKKMVNFMAPDDKFSYPYSHESRNVLFRSLFQ